MDYETEKAKFLELTKARNAAIRAGDHDAPVLDQWDADRKALMALLQREIDACPHMFYTNHSYGDTRWDSCENCGALSVHERG